MNAIGRKLRKREEEEGGNKYAKGEGKTNRKKTKEEGKRKNAVVKEINLNEKDEEQKGN